MLREKCGPKTSQSPPFSPPARIDRGGEEEEDESESDLRRDDLEQELGGEMFRLQGSEEPFAAARGLYAMQPK